MNLVDLQREIKRHKVEAYLINHSNMFIKQDLLDSENKILELTGFSGSNGLLLVLQKKAILLVDGRYEIQAKNEVMDKNIEVVCTKLYPTSSAILPYIDKQINSLMYNPWCFTKSTIDHLKKTFQECILVADEYNLLGSLTTDKTATVLKHKAEFCGKSSTEKMQILLDFMNQKNLDYYLLCDAASVSWLLNLRSDLLPDTPILRAFALIDKKGKYKIFADNIKKIKAYDFSCLETELIKISKYNVGVDPGYTPQKITNILKRNAISEINPLILEKNIKSDREIQGFENSHLRDGVALTKFLYWFDKNWKNKTELGVCEKLHQFRSKQHHFYSESFSTIAAYGTNAAIVHYSPDEQTNKVMKEGNVLLLDSGAQYFDGTTDVTRTIPVGNVTNQEICNAFTYVLKAHIALASTIFPNKVSEKVLDGICRRELWKYGLEYKHGSGHGVGYFSGVHETPPSLSDSGNAPLYANMVLSIEPGYYKEGFYGIRIENLYKTVVINEEPYSGKFLKFVPLTLAPIDKRLVNKYLLSTDEITYLNNYNQNVFEKVGPFLDKDEAEWLKEMCAPL